MDSDSMPVVFTPDNERYLGRELLFHFDQIISSLMEQNATAPRPMPALSPIISRWLARSSLRRSVSRCRFGKLIRQGYLFGAHVLLRALVERAAILLYLHLYPEEIDRWNRGWHQHDAPSLAKMFEAIQAKQQRDTTVRGRDLTASMNSLLHGKPDSAPWNLISMSGEPVGHAVSKILNRPELCGELCANVIPWVAVVQGMMAAYFPDEHAA